MPFASRAQHPLRQFMGLLSPELLFKMEDRGLWMDQLVDMTASDIGAWGRIPVAPLRGYILRPHGSAFRGTWRLFLKA